jgi:hypothetical protein
MFQAVAKICPLHVTQYILADYSACEMASTGQTSTQVPQSVHFAGSIMNISSPSDIASSGHSGSQAPQLMHSSLITCAIFIPPNVMYNDTPESWFFQ